MEIVATFKKKDGTKTPKMTEEEIRDGKYKKYGITDEQVEDMFFRSAKHLIEASYPNVTVKKKVEEAERSA